MCIRILYITRKIEIVFEFKRKKINKIVSYIKIKENFKTRSIEVKFFF